MKIKECCTVISQECIAKDIYSMWISTKAIAREAKPGQFVSVYTKDASRLLPRPISLCEMTGKRTPCVSFTGSRETEPESFPGFAPGIPSISWDLLATDFRWRRRKGNVSC